MAVTALAGTAGCGPASPTATPTAIPSSIVAAGTPTATATTTVTSATPPYAGPPLIDHVQWVSDNRGRALRVYPSAPGRSATEPGARATAWQEVLRAAPDADTASMRDQFYCHWDFARIVEPNKVSWNLETWRPVVGYTAMAQAGCNPGGPE